jgi:5-methylcytosine-specific restriction endonuclease McrA
MVEAGAYMLQGNKICSNCKESKARSEFRRNKGTSDGLHNQCKECRKAYSASNSERLKKYKQDYYAKVGRKGIRTAVSRWSAANRDVRNIISRRRRALLREVETDNHTVEDLNAHIVSLGGVCYYCGTEWTQIDHVVPLARGGSDTLFNIVPACAECNQKKGSKTAEEFAITLP